LSRYIVATGNVNAPHEVVAIGKVFAPKPGTFQITIPVLSPENVLFVDCSAIVVRLVQFDRKTKRLAAEPNGDALTIYDGNVENPVVSLEDGFG
jgi:hypothetical protein